MLSVNYFIPNKYLSRLPINNLKSQLRYLPNSGDILDIKARGKYPANVLSNLYDTYFEIDGIKVRSMEGFLQSLKEPDPVKQKYICSLSGFDAKKYSHSLRRDKKDILYHWRGNDFVKDSKDYRSLLDKILKYGRTNKPFKFEGFDVTSVNTFLVGLLEKDSIKQKDIFRSSEQDYKYIMKNIKISYMPRTLYWQGKEFARDSEFYKTLLKRAYKLRYDSDASFRDALKKTVGMTLKHSLGKNHSINDTILTEQEFIDNLNLLRDKYINNAQ